MKYHLGQRVKVVKLRGSYSKNYLGKVGEVREISEYGYHIILDETGQEATFFEDELEAVHGQD